MNLCSERLKNEVEQLLTLSFSMFNQLLHFVSTHMRGRLLISRLLFLIPITV